VDSLSDDLLHIEMVGTKFNKTGTLLAMTVDDGPHHANNVALMAMATIALLIFIRHVDKEGRVPDRWRSSTESWTFRYPGRTAG
jgi:uncharacterized protein involved in high-affinity Fe2+ transport